MKNWEYRAIILGALFATGLALPSVAHSQEPVGNNPRLGFVLGSDYQTGTLDDLINLHSISSVVSIDPQDNPSQILTARRLKTNDPASVTMMRVFSGSEDLSFDPNSDPKSTAVVYFKRVIEPALVKLGPDQKSFDLLVDSPNENFDSKGYSWETLDGVGKWSLFYQKLAELVDTNTMGSCVASIPVGNIPGGTTEEIGQTFSPYVDLIKNMTEKKLPIRLCYHSYTNDITKEDTGKYMEDHVVLLNSYLRQQLPDQSEFQWKWEITEAGLDGGWLDKGIAPQAYHDWYYRLYRDLSQQMGPDLDTINGFTLGASPDYWPTYDLNRILSLYKSGH